MIRLMAKVTKGKSYKIYLPNSSRICETSLRESLMMAPNTRQQLLTLLCKFKRIAGHLLKFNYT